MQPEPATHDASRAFPVLSEQVAPQPHAQKKAFTSFDFASFQATSNEQAKAEAISKGKLTRPSFQRIPYYCLNALSRLSDGCHVACVQKPSCSKLLSTSSRLPAMMTTFQTRLKRPIEKVRDPRRHLQHLLLAAHREQRRRGTAKSASETQSSAAAGCCSWSNGCGQVKWP